MKFLKILLIIIAVLSIAYLGMKVLSNSSDKNKVINTDSLFYKDLEKKSIIAGAINPRKEIKLKANVSGILDEVFVEPGDNVKKGDKIAIIRIIPNAVSLNRAETEVDRAKINFKLSKIQYKRQKKLLEKKVISIDNFDKIEYDYLLKKQALDAAKSNYKLTKEGITSKKLEAASNIVYATGSGMVLDIPNKEGSSVIEANNFNEGTTIANIANMGKLIFEGDVDESEVAKMSLGIELELNIGALEESKYKATLEYISPKGVSSDGAVKFKIRANLELPKEHNLRAGYSANASISFEKKDNVLVINEKNIIYKDNKTYVKRKVEENVFEKTEIKIGISDGVYAEVISGVTEDDIVQEL